MKYVKERTLMIVIIIVQFIVIGVLSSMIILNDDEKEVEYNSSHIVLEYHSWAYEWSTHSLTLRIHSDGFYSLKDDIEDEKSITSYLEEGQLEDITYFLSSHNVSEYNGYRNRTTNQSNPSYFELYYYPVYGEYVTCSGCIQTPRMPKDLSEINDYLWDLMGSLD